MPTFPNQHHRSSRENPNASDRAKRTSLWPCRLGSVGTRGGQLRASSIRRRRPAVVVSLPKVGVVLAAASVIAAGGTPALAMPPRDEPDSRPRTDTQTDPADRPQADPGPSVIDKRAELVAECAYVHGIDAKDREYYAHHSTWNLLDGSTTNARYEENTPVGSPLHLDPREIDFLRCIAPYEPALVAIQAGPNDVLRLELRGDTGLRQDVTAIRLGTRTDSGKWVVAHRRGEGEVASAWSGPHSAPTAGFFLFKPDVQPAGTRADTVGFVKPGFLGIATPVASFDWQTFWALSSGMQLTFTWICDWCHISD